jgi:hypothetical protein
LQTFTQGYLLSVTADPDLPDGDNLIIAGPHNIVASYTNGVWKVTFCFIPNSPVNMLLFLGFMLDPSVTVGNQTA